MNLNFHKLALLSLLAAAAGVTGQEDGEEIPIGKAPLVAGFGEPLGNCTGAICGTWGDPHIITCDALQYDCQGIGIFNLMENHMFSVQAHFVGIGVKEQEDADEWNLHAGASITNDIAIDFLLHPEVPRMQFGFGELHYNVGDDLGDPSENGCNTGVSFYPLNMAKGNSKRYVGKTLEECRHKCVSRKGQNKGCTKFQYWADGSCHINDDEQVEIVNPKHWTKVLTGTAESDCGKEQSTYVGGTDEEVAKHGSMNEGKCPLLMYLDGELHDISDKTDSEDTGYLWGAEGDANYVLQTGKIITIVTDHGSTNSSEIHLHQKGNGARHRWSCHWDFNICLPASDQEKFEKFSIGLLGSPDGKKKNDWMDPVNNVLPINTGSSPEEAHDMLDYCYKNWCVNETESIMTYHGDKTYEDYKCELKDIYDFDIDDCEVGADVLRTICANQTELGQDSYDACLLDCCLGGCADVNPEIGDIKEFGDDDDDKNEPPLFPRCDINELGSTKDTVCPDTDIVTLLETKGTQPLPEGADIFYEIDIHTDTVTFKVNNPFPSSADIYVKHEAQAATSSFLVPTCDARPDTCFEDVEPITVACTTYEGHTPFALVQVYIASYSVDDGAVIDDEDNDDENAAEQQVTVDKCCGFNDILPSGIGIVEYVFKVQCACPVDNSQ